MKNKFKFIYSILFITVLGITTTSIAQNNQIDPILEIEKDNCEGTTEVNYRSQKLTSPDGKTTVYFEGILRRIGKKGDKSLEGYCWPYDGRKTPVLTMLIEKENNLNKIDQGSGSGQGGYVETNPISFSPDGKYLITHNIVSYDGGDSIDDYPIFNTNEYKILSIKECNNSSYGGTYQGFISASEILFDCNEAQYEVVNLQKQSIRKVSESFAKSAKIIKLYGTISGEMTILKRQVFPARR